MERNLTDILESITFRRAAVLREIEAGATEHDIAGAFGMTYAGVRSHVRDLKRITGCKSLEELAKFWSLHADAWVDHATRVAGHRFGKEYREHDTA